MVHRRTSVSRYWETGSEVFDRMKSWGGYIIDGTLGDSNGYDDS